MNLSTLSEVSLTVSHEVKPLQKNQNSDSLNRTKKCLTGPPSNKKKRKRNILVLSISLSIADSTFSEKIGQKMCCFGSLLTFQWFMILKNPETNWTAEIFSWLVKYDATNQIMISYKQEPRGSCLFCLSVMTFWKNFSIIWCFFFFFFWKRTFNPPYSKTIVVQECMKRKLFVLSILQMLEKRV